MTNEFAKDREVIAAATEGPWENCPDSRPDIMTACRQGGYMNGGHLATISKYENNHLDAEFIARARTRWPIALDALEAAQLQRLRVYAWLGKYRDELPPSAVVELQDILRELI